MAWTEQQDQALKAVDNWIKEFYLSKNVKTRKQVFRLFGPAGSGKTTLAKHFAESVGSVGSVAFGAFAGKAALVLRKKGCIGARTLHSMIYIAEQDKKTGEVHFRLNRATSILNDVDLLITDECSMVDDEIGNDLLSFGKPILALGDPYQLPPIKGAGFFTGHPPDFLLTEIHRQAEENPIIYLANLVRNKIYPEHGDYGDSRIISRMNTTDFMEAEQVLCGRNITRTEQNMKMRKLLGYDPDMPVIKDKLICLKNDKDLAIFNGGLFHVGQLIQSKYKTNFLHMSLDSQDEPERGPTLVKVHKSLFIDDVPKPDWKVLKGSQEFDYSYSITGHKAQGSQWENVLITEESYCFGDDWSKWLYTCLTRASERIILVK